MAWFQKVFYLDDANQEKEKSLEPSRRENVLVMRLANKEQEVQDYVVCIFCVFLLHESHNMLS